MKLYMIGNVNPLPCNHLDDTMKEHIQSEDPVLLFGNIIVMSGAINWYDTI